MDNLKEFKKLIKRYETISFDEVNTAWEAWDSRKYLVSLIGRDVAQVLTGYGFGFTCTLCIAVRENCNLCVYDSSNGCFHGENKETYDNIEQARTPEELLDAFRKRAEHLRKSYASKLTKRKLT